MACGTVTLGAVQAAPVARCMLAEHLESNDGSPILLSRLRVNHAKVGTKKKNECSSAHCLWVPTYSKKYRCRSISARSAVAGKTADTRVAQSEIVSLQEVARSALSGNSTLNGAQNKLAFLDAPESQVERIDGGQVLSTNDAENPASKAEERLEEKAPKSFEDMEALISEQDVLGGNHEAFILEAIGRSDIHFIAPQGKRRHLPLFVFLPGLDGTGLYCKQQLPDLIGEFDVRSLVIPGADTSSFQELADATAELIRHERVARQRLAESAESSNGAYNQASAFSDGTLEAQKEYMSREETSLKPPHPVTVYGESFGSGIALQLASSCPEEVHSLIILNSISAYRRQPLLQFGSMFMGSVPASLHDLGSTVLAPILADWRRLSEESQFLLLPPFSTRVLTPDAVTRRAQMMLAMDPSEDMLARISAATLLLASGKDRLMPSVQEADWLASRIPNCRVKVLPNSGHVAMLERDMCLASLLREAGFLDAPTSAQNQNTVTVGTAQVETVEGLESPLAASEQADTSSLGAGGVSQNGRSIANASAFVGEKSESESRCLEVQGSNSSDEKGEKMGDVLRKATTPAEKAKEEPSLEESFGDIGKKLTRRVGKEAAEKAKQEQGEPKKDPLTKSVLLSDGQQRPDGQKKRTVPIGEVVRRRRSRAAQRVSKPIFQSDLRWLQSAGDGLLAYLGGLGGRSQAGESLSLEEPPTSEIEVLSKGERAEELVDGRGNGRALSNQELPRVRSRERALGFLSELAAGDEVEGSGVNTGLPVSSLATVEAGTGSQGARSTPERVVASNEAGTAGLEKEAFAGQCGEPLQEGSVMKGTSAQTNGAVSGSSPSENGRVVLDGPRATKSAPPTSPSAVDLKSEKETEIEPRGVGSDGLSKVLERRAGMVATSVRGSNGSLDAEGSSHAEKPGNADSTEVQKQRTEGAGGAKDEEKQAVSGVKKSPAELVAGGVAAGKAFDTMLEDMPQYRLWNWLTRPEFYGMDNIPVDAAPLLFVGNHTLFGIYDMPLMMYELRKRKGLVLRGLAHEWHWKSPLGDIFEKYGAVRATPRNCFNLLKAGEPVLLYPGGGREVAKRKGEKYKLLWKDDTDFVRLAMKCKATIVPFATVGVEDAFDILMGPDEIMASPLGDVIRPALKATGFTEDVIPSLATGGNLLPRPERLYFNFGEPIHTSHYTRKDLKDKDECARLYKQAKTAVEDGILLLQSKRSKDPLRDLFPRTMVNIVEGWDGS